MSLDALTRAALMGTSRQRPATAELPAALSGLDAELAVERRLLRDAALLSVYQAAGERPARVSALPAPAPAEQRPECPPAAAGHLAAILHGPYQSALTEWLAALAASGSVIPPEHARALLEEGDRDAAVALAIEPALSERARWLAAQTGNWAWARAGDPAQRFETETRAVRLHLLRALRRNDPAAARDLLAGTWAQDAARDREAFLAELAAGLSDADEPFLQAALDDRAQSVRARAGELLCALPGSAYARRMAARLDPLIDTRLRSLTVALPDGELTDELRRDGLTDTPPRGLGRGAWILGQIVAGAPLGVWERVERSPSKLLARRVADRMGDLLRDAWAAAAVRQRNPEFAQALLDRGHADAATVRALIGVLDPGGRERYALKALNAAPQGADTHLGALTHPWSAEFTAAVAARIAEAPHPRWAAALARHGDPSLGDRIPARDPDLAAGMHLRDAAAQLAFRRAMLDTLKEIQPA